MGPKNNDEDDENNSDNVAITSTVTATNSNNDEAQRLLDKVKQMRMEIAALTGQTVEDVEREAALKKSLQLENEQKSTILRQQMKSQQPSPQRQHIIPVPETASEQIQQASHAIERAYRDGHIQKQIVRFAFVPIVTSSSAQTNHDRDLDHQNVLFVRNDQDWPGGVQQIYREAARPYTSQLLQQLRIQHPKNSQSSSMSTSSFGNMKPKPMIQEQTLWDFDGSAILSATNRDDNTDDEETSTTTTLIQALVHPNTDNRYFNDILQMDERLATMTTVDHTNRDDTQRNGAVNLIINPFWTNATSWGFNIFAPQAQQRASDIIFSPPAKTKNGRGGSSSGDGNGEGGYIETYSIITKSVRGEDCIAIKAYPYDWQLYAYLEEMNDRRYYGTTTTTVHLGSSMTEPTITDFVQLLNNRTEFQYSKNMRQMQRTMNK